MHLFYTPEQFKSTRSNENQLPKRCNWKDFQFKDFKSISFSRIELKDENDYEKSDE